MIFFFANAIVVDVEEFSDVLGLNCRLDSLETELSLTSGNGFFCFDLALALAALLVCSQIPYCCCCCCCCWRKNDND